jgi:hypothetical protein
MANFRLDVSQQAHRKGSSVKAVVFLSASGSRAGVYSLGIANSYP